MTPPHEPPLDEPQQPTEDDPFSTSEPESVAIESDDATASVPLLQALLPRTAPRLDGYDLAGGTTMEASRGGTLWATFRLNDGRTAMAAALFQGSDTPASLALAVARGFVMDFGARSATPAEALAATNDALARTRPEVGSQLVACAVVVPGPSGVSWACAGPVHGGVIRRAGTFDALPSHGPPLGMLPGFTYGVNEVALGPGDEVLVLAGASDGLYRGAADLVASLTGKPAGEVVSTVHRAIRKARSSDTPVETSVLFLRKH